MMCLREHRTLPIAIPIKDKFFKHQFNVLSIQKNYWVNQCIAIIEGFALVDEKSSGLVISIGI